MESKIINAVVWKWQNKVNSRVEYFVLFPSDRVMLYAPDHGLQPTEIKLWQDGRDFGLKISTLYKGLKTD